jgi:dTDP-4-amino-4,6-dideoxygalactose transaminase
MNRFSDILRNARFINGAEIVELEKKLADYAGAKHCVACSSGTDALVIILMAAGIGKGDAVFVPTFTFFATAEAVSLVGATPVFVDVDPVTYNIDPDKLEDAVRSIKATDSVKPKAVIAVDLFGQPADYITIEKVAKQYGLLLIEDGAQGFGGRIGDRKACSFGYAAATSFFPAKPLGCYGDGGAVFTDDESLAEIMVSIREHGKGADKYRNERLGLNARLDTLQAAVLLEKMKIFDDELESRDLAASLYAEALHDRLTVPTVMKGYFSSWAQYTVLAKNGEERSAIMDRLSRAGVPSAIYYASPLHKQPAYANEESSGFDFSVSDDICKRVFSIPIHPYLTEDDIINIANVVKE